MVINYIGNILSQGDPVAFSHCWDEQQLGTAITVREMEQGAAFKEHC